MQKIFHKLERYFSSWSLGILHQQKGLWSMPANRKYIRYARLMNRRGHHILIRPDDHREPYYLLCDDLSQADLSRDHCRDGIWKKGRLLIETSPQNYQVWIHFGHPLSIAEKTFWLKRLRSDPGCSPRHRWGRCPGFRNRKAAHEKEGHYPLAKLIWVDWVNQASIAPVHRSPITVAHHHRRPFPSPPAGACAQNLSRRDYERGNESATDFSYALALMARGVADDEILSRLLQERQSWAHHGHGERRRKYLQRTLRQARTKIGR